jgi:hypothetical protein
LAKGSKSSDSLGSEPEHRVVLAVIYDKAGNVLREWPGFVIGRDKVGHGTSMAMGAVQFIDPESGELVRAWNPWGVLGG